MTQLLLDTCAAIWISGNDAISPEATAAVDKAQDDRIPILVSPILGWEIGLLTARKRLALPARPEAWLTRLMQAPNLRYADMPASLLLQSAFLPGNPPQDAADRIIIATAREFDLTIVTRDRLILAYAEAGHVRALAC